jgi:uncharacterized YccA/Bax inhibitor family protein
MQSSNPVFARSAGFNGRGGTAYADFGTPGAPMTHTQVGTGRMTIDTVVQKTGITLGVVVLAAAATWILTGDVVVKDSFGDPTLDSDKAQMLYTLSIVGALGGFVLAMVNSFKRVVSPPLVLAYAALEGVFIGAMSKTFQLAFGDGVVTGAVLGTVAAVAGTLAAYKYFNISVSDKFRKWVVAAMFGFVAVVMLDFVLSLFGSAIGFNGFGGLGLVMSFIGLGLGVLMLILDFDFVERGIAAGLPERESWRAAFGFTVTIIWIYIELLRILAILRGND